MSAPLKILVTGASGFIGSSLMRFLDAQGHRPIPLSRGQPKPGGPSWNPDVPQIDLAPAGPVQAVVHLGGHSIAGRWTPAYQQRIRHSRVHGTQFLCEALAALPQPPQVLVTASGIGYYGDRGNALLTEESSMGSGFLAEVTRDWEAATAAAQVRGIRVVHLRIGLVVSRSGGGLARMLPAFKLGLGGPLSHGRQYWSWIALEDVNRIILHAITTSSLSGPVNVVAPSPVTNREFTQTLGKVLKRPAFLPVPAFALRLLFGPMADEALLASTRVHPTKLERSGYRFIYPQLEQALQEGGGQMDVSRTRQSGKEG